MGYSDNENSILFCGQLDTLALRPLEEVGEQMFHLSYIVQYETSPLA